MIAALVLVVTLFSPSSPRPASGAALSATPAGTLAAPSGLVIQDAAFSPDGKTIAASVENADQSSVSADGVDIWNFSGPEPALTVKNPPGDGIGGLAFSPTNVNALAIGVGNDIHLENLAPKKAVEPATYDGPDHVPPAAVAWTPDGKTIAEFDREGYVYLLDVASGLPQAVPSAKSPGAAGPEQIAVSPDGKALAAADSAGNVYVWSLSGGAPPAVSSGPRLIESGARQAGNHMVAFSPDGKTLAIVGQSEIRLLNVATGTYSAPLATPGTSPEAVAFAPNGASLAATDAAGHIDLWDLATGKPVASKVPGTNWTGLAFSPDGKTLAAFGGTGDSKIYLYGIKYAPA